MFNLIKTGRFMFAVGLFFIGVLCILNKDFIVGRPPAWPESFGINPSLAYISAGLLMICTLCILFNKQAGPAALVIAAMIFLLSMLRHLPKFDKDWVNAYKTLALIGGACIVSASIFEENSRKSSKADRGAQRISLLVTMGSIMLAIFFLASGYAHFKWANFVRDLIPEYIPFRLFWAYFCGICLLACGIGILIPGTRKWAALLGGIMIFGWFLLLHIPRFLTDPGNWSDRLGVCESFAFAGILFVLAGMYRNKKT